MSACESEAGRGFEACEPKELIATGLQERLIQCVMECRTCGMGGGGQLVTAAISCPPRPRYHDGMAWLVRTRSRPMLWTPIKKGLPDSGLQRPVPIP